MRFVIPMTVVELDDYIADANRVFSESEKNAATDTIAKNPLLGDLIVGTGGVRKLRWNVAGHGKRGGARIVYYYYNESIPVFLLSVFTKNEKTNLSDKECNELKKLTRILVESYGRPFDE